MDDKDKGGEGQEPQNETETAPPPENPAPEEPVLEEPTPENKQAEDSAAEPEEKPHPAIAQIEGAGVVKGTRIDISGAHRAELPVGVVVADRLGRVYRVDEDETGEIMTCIGHLV